MQKFHNIFVIRLGRGGINGEIEMYYDGTEGELFQVKLTSLSTIIKVRLSTYEDVVKFFGNRDVTPPNIRSEVMKSIYRSEPNFKKWLNQLPQKRS